MDGPTELGARRKRRFRLARIRGRSQACCENSKHRPARGILSSLETRARVFPRTLRYTPKRIGARK
jgi:hypothetical protein